MEDYNKYTVCNFEGEDKSCSDQYEVDADVGTFIVVID